ncbi:MAG: hypothetical protein K0R15_652 [Clostridiales bacterium]|nr:hypothetical protein [Clostridiales bacterium]
MFDNIGEKLKMLSGIGVISAVICFIAFLGSLDNSESAILYFVYTFSSIIGAMLIYGFGELIQTTQGIYSMLSKSNLIGRLEEEKEDGNAIAEVSVHNAFDEKMNSDDKSESIESTTQSIKRCKSCNAICNVNTKTCDMCGYKF